MDTEKKTAPKLTASQRADLQGLAGVSSGSFWRLNGARAKSFLAKGWISGPTIDFWGNRIYKLTDAGRAVLRGE